MFFDTQPAVCSLPSINRAPVCASRKHRPCICSSSRHYSAYSYYWLFPLVPSDLTGTVARNRHYSTGTIEKPLLLLYSINTPKCRSSISPAPWYCIVRMLPFNSGMPFRFYLFFFFFFILRRMGKRFNYLTEDHSSQDLRRTQKPTFSKFFPTNILCPLLC